MNLSIEENKKYLDDGVLIVSNFLTLDEVRKFRKTLDDYFLNHKSFSQGNHGKILSGFAGQTPELEELNLFHHNKRLLRILGSVIFTSSNFIFAEHSDLHQNKSTGWHRDTKDYLCKERGNGDEQGLWSDDCHIIKACLLLQDHHSNDFGMSFKLGSHRAECENPATFYAETKSTDLIIFDQRILHAGQTAEKSYLQTHGANRYLITYAYGLQNSHTLVHMKGAQIRQNEQRAMFQ